MTTTLPSLAELVEAIQKQKEIPGVLTTITYSDQITARNVIYDPDTRAGLWVSDTHLAAILGFKTSQLIYNNHFSSLTIPDSSEILVAVDQRNTRQSCIPKRLTLTAYEKIIKNRPFMIPAESALNLIKAVRSASTSR